MKIGSFIFIMILWMLSSCTKKAYEGPPDSSGYDPQLKVTHTIAQLLSMQQGVAITEDITVSGIVVMDDKSGNYYKELVIEDSTAGMELLLDQNNLYNDYPVGRKVYVKCKGLYLGNYGGNPQLGFTPGKTGAVSNIPAVSIGEYVVKANYPNPIEVDTYNLADLKSLGTAHLNTLVAIRNVQFNDDEVGKPYADLPAIASATSVNFNDCSTAKGVLRSSGYAKFQPYLTPSGNGIITGIFTRYNGTTQLAIRDTTDVQFYGSRCTGSGGGSTPTSITHLDALRAMTATVNDSITTLPQTAITGVVTSDKNAANILSANMVIQDGESGIVVRFSSNHSFILGDSVTIDITSGKLSWYYNLLQVSNVSPSKAVRSGTGKKITPRIATLAQCSDHYKDWESTLVKIKEVSVTGGGTYSGNKTITDASGSLIMYTRTAATFATQTVPSSPKSFTGILSIYGATKQLQLRNLNDVQ